MTAPTKRDGARRVLTALPPDVIQSARVGAPAGTVAHRVLIEDREVDELGTTGCAIVFHENGKAFRGGKFPHPPMAGRGYFEAILILPCDTCGGSGEVTREHEQTNGVVVDAEVACGACSDE